MSVFNLAQKRSFPPLCSDSGDSAARLRDFSSQQTAQFAQNWANALFNGL
jgi:hypothetical protein